MKLDYIEIGTSDFNTVVEENDGCGISMEPISFYLERLPVKDNNIKLNFALTEFDGEEIVYYVLPEDIIKYNLPEWVRGCNSICNPHPSVIKVLDEKKISHIYKAEKIKTISWDTLIKKYNITSLDFLKIDTEGYDYKIIKYIVESKTNILPKKIIFETNILTSEENIIESIELLKSRGYQLIERGNENTTMVLKNILPDKIIFSSDDSQYLNFWKHNSEICSKILNITPVLLHITDEESDFFWDEYGIVKKIKKDSNLPNLSQIIRLFCGKFFENDYLLISDIDMFLFDKSFLIKKLKGHIEYDLTIIGSDAYDKNRDETKPELANTEYRFPMCYIFCKGSILNKIMNIDAISSVYDLYQNNEFKFGFDSDEIIFTKNVLDKDLKINKVKRGYKSNYFLNDRIEKCMFNKVDYFNLSIKNMDSLDGFKEAHCPNYNDNMCEILHIKALILYRK